MANVQPDKFTRIANELMEVVPLFNFNGTQLRIILVLWRYTYGFKRKEHGLSISFLCKATGISKRQTQKEVNRLIDLNIINEIQKPSFNTSRIIGFNKDYDQWKLEHSTTKEQQMNNSSEVNNSSTQQVNDSTPQQMNNSSPKKESIKENIKESIQTENPFNFFTDNFGMITPFISESIIQWENELSSELIVEAMKKSLKQGVRKFNYVEGILKDWNSKGYKTLDDLNTEEKREQKPEEPNKDQEELKEELEYIESTLKLTDDYWLNVEKTQPPNREQLRKRRDELNEQLRIH